MRGLIGESQSDQTVNGFVFSYLRNSANFFLKYKRDVCIDATNTSPKTRKEFLTLAKSIGAETVALCINTPLALCKIRNQQRDRKVPEEVIDKQFAALKFPVKDDGEFNSIIYID